MYKITWEHMSGGSYWLAPLDCHSRVVGRWCWESCVRIRMVVRIG